MTNGIATYERQSAAMQRQLHEMQLVVDLAEAPTRTALTIAADLGITLDDWQREALATDKDLLVLVTRQGGKGVIAEMLGLECLIGRPGSRIVVLAPTEEQSKRLLKRIRRRFHRLHDRPPVIAESRLELSLRNGSEIFAVPGSEESLRGIDSVDLLLIDEAAIVDDELFESVNPMTIVANGRIAAFSTARGKRGWFHREYMGGSDSWHRIKRTAHDIGRLPQQALDKQRARIGDFMFQQEYLVEFLDTEDQLFGTDLVESAVNPDLKAWAF